MPLETVFLTGATGFIGSHLVADLLGRGCEVRCLIRSGSSGSVPAGAVTVPGRLEDPASYRAALAGCDTVFHLAGLVGSPSRANLLRTNGLATARLADACAAQPVPPRLVYVSSLAAAGPPPRGRARRDECDPATPVSDYGRSKRTGEEALERRAGRAARPEDRRGLPGDPADGRALRGRLPHAAAVADPRRRPRRTAGAGRDGR
jgi:nucleoside-diphosphate-sugar epimerase